jgi:hypothetical protein
MKKLNRELIMTDIAQLLGKEAEDLLQHRCTTIPAENLYLPGADFVDRIMIDNNRPNTVLRSMQSLLKPWPPGRHRLPVYSAGRSGH